LRGTRPGYCVALSPSPLPLSAIARAWFAASALVVLVGGRAARRDRRSRHRVLRHADGNVVVFFTIQSNIAVGLSTGLLAGPGPAGRVVPRCGSSA
jgi:hypothetical protein